MKFNIAYAPDDKYINQTIVSMVSAIENNKEHEIEFIIIYSKSHLHRQPCRCRRNSHVVVPQ